MFEAHKVSDEMWEAIDSVATPEDREYLLRVCIEDLENDIRRLNIELSNTEKERYYNWVRFIRSRLEANCLRSGTPFDEEKSFHNVPHPYLVNPYTRETYDPYPYRTTRLSGK